MDDLRARKASEIIGTILSPDVAAKAGSWSRFFGSWERAAGERLSAHSRPVDVRNGIVIVEADHPGWVQLLQLEQKRILDTIKRSFPELEITGIAFKTAKDRSVYMPQDRSAGSDEAVTDDEPKEDNEDTGKRTVKETIDAVEDQGFREILSSLAKEISRKGK
ncbi:MAG: DUF721 domain-containing protein [Clostridia bacterium]|jgi:hypothetical protein